MSWVTVLENLVSSEGLRGDGQRNLGPEMVSDLQMMVGELKKCRIQEANCYSIWCSVGYGLVTELEISEWGRERLRKNDDRVEQVH